MLTIILKLKKKWIYKINIYKEEFGELHHIYSIYLNHLFQLSVAQDLFFAIHTFVIATASLPKRNEALPPLLIFTCQTMWLTNGHFFT